MSRARKLALLLLACGAIGALAGYLMRCANDLTRAAGGHADVLPGLPGQPPPPRDVMGWTRPPHDSPEGRLIDQMIGYPGDFPPGRLVELATSAPNPAVRETAAVQIGFRLAGSRDLPTTRGLTRCLETEKDPMVRRAIQRALGAVTGLEPRPSPR